MDEFPKLESGVMHLTPAGWVRKDHAPFPKDRLESWTFDREQPADDAKESICMTRFWLHQGAEADRAALSARFGLPFQATPLCNITLGCEV